MLWQHHLARKYKVFRFGVERGVGIHKGDIYNLDVLNKRLGKQLSPDGGADVSSLYMDDGYLYFQVNPIETRVYNDTIDHEIRIVEGSQATIRNVTIPETKKQKTT